MIKLLLIGLILLNFSFLTIAETIYQWSDPWGQIQYSKTPVPGAMVSDLTELPKLTATTEQQKQDAMVRKLQEMKQKKLLQNQNTAAQQMLSEQALQTKNYCRQLRLLIADIQTRNLWQYPILGFSLLPGNYGPMHFGLSKELRHNCR